MDQLDKVLVVDLGQLAGSKSGYSSSDSAERLGASRETRDVRRSLIRREVRIRLGSSQRVVPLESGLEGFISQEQTNQLALQDSSEQVVRRYFPGLKRETEGLKLIIGFYRRKKLLKVGLKSSYKVSGPRKIPAESLHSH